MAQYVTLHKIGVSPSGEQFEISGFDDDGSPIRRRRTLHIPALVIHDFADESLIAELLRLDAIRELTVAEMARGEVIPETRAAFEEISTGRAR